MISEGRESFSLSLLVDRCSLAETREPRGERESERIDDDDDDDDYGMIADRKSSRLTDPLLSCSLSLTPPPHLLSSSCLRPAFSLPLSCLSATSLDHQATTRA